MYGTATRPEFVKRRCAQLLYFVTGPIDKDYVAGVLFDWHLEVFNNSENTLDVELKVFDISGESTVLIGDTARQISPHSHQYMTLYTNLAEHSIVQIQYPATTGEMFLTLYGRDMNGNALPGAIFFNKQLMQIPNGIS